MAGLRITESAGYGRGGGGSRQKDQSRRGSTSDLADFSGFIAPDAVENRYQRGVRAVRSFYGTGDLVAGPADGPTARVPKARPSLVEGGNIFSSLWGGFLPDPSLPPQVAPDAPIPAVPPVAPLIGQTVPAIKATVPVDFKVKRAVAQNFRKRIEQVRQQVSGSRSDSSAGRGSISGAGGYQGGTYGGYGGANIGQGIGQAYRNR